MVGVGSHKHDDRGGFHACQCLCKLQPALARHMNVQQYQLYRRGLRCLQKLQGLLGIGRILDMVRAVLAITEQRAQSGACQGLVVNDQYVHVLIVWCLQIAWAGER